MPFASIGHPGGNRAGAIGSAPPSELGDKLVTQFSSRRLAVLAHPAGVPRSQATKSGQEGGPGLSVSGGRGAGSGIRSSDTGGVSLVSWLLPYTNRPIRGACGSGEREGQPPRPRGRLDLLVCSRLSTSLLWGRF